MPEGRVIGPGPVNAAMVQVFGALLKPGALDGLVVVAGMDENSIREGLSLMKEDPELKMILWIPPMAESMMGPYCRDLQEGPKLKLVRSLNLTDILRKITECGEERKALVQAQVEEEGLEMPLDGEVLKLSMAMLMRTLGVLQHDLKPYVVAEKSSTYHRIIAEARKLFDIKDSASDEQVVEFIQRARVKLPERMSGEIEGVYCDLDDTLLMRDGSVNTEVLAMLERYRAGGKRVAIWTGGDLEAARQKLAGGPLADYELVSKMAYTGATAEIVIDNVSAEKFVIQYGIKPKNYVRV